MWVTFMNWEYVPSYGPGWHNHGRALPLVKYDEKKIGLKVSTKNKFPKSSLVIGALIAATENVNKYFSKTFAKQKNRKYTHLETGNLHQFFELHLYVNDVYT